MNLAQESVIGEKVHIGHLEVNVYTIPTDFPESDGTLQWDRTTLVLVTAHAADKQGIGYTYASPAAASIIADILRPIVVGGNAMDIPACYTHMINAVRNNGNAGTAMMAISAVDVALWDLKARLLDVSLSALLGKVHDRVPVYGSGGFTSYTTAQLQKQLSGWAEDGFRHVKMKIGREPARDPGRVHDAREAIGNDVELFVDANGAYTVRQALDLAHRFAEYNVTWFEEPVIADNSNGLRFIRERAPAAIKIAGGEYASNLAVFRSMVEAQTVDVLQADATRCGGITGFLKAGALAEAFCIPFSSHCAPTLHLAPAASLPGFYIGEYFHDHVRIESALLDGFIEPRGGYLHTDESRPGLGVRFKYQDAEKYRQ